MEKNKEETAKAIVEEFFDVNTTFRLYNRNEKEEYHIKEYLKYLVRKHL